MDAAINTKISSVVQSQFLNISNFLKSLISKFLYLNNSEK